VQKKKQERKGLKERGAVKRGVLGEKPVKCNMESPTTSGDRTFRGSGSKKSRNWGRTIHRGNRREKTYMTQKNI